MFKFVDYCYLTNALCEQVCKGQKVDTHETFCANTENDTTKYVNMDALFKKKRQMTANMDETQVFAINQTIKIEIKLV